MSRRCKPGIRARIIESVNAGKIVVVVRRYFGEPVSDARWPRQLFPWVVTSLGPPLRAFYIETGEEAPPSMTIVVDDCDLEPLRDDDERDDTSEGVPSTIKRDTVIAGQSSAPKALATRRTAGPTGRAMGAP